MNKEPISSMNSCVNKGYIATNKRLIIDAYEAVLGQEDINFEEDFFKLGGDSLKFVELIARLEQDLKLEFTIPELLEYSTINQLNDWLIKKRIVLIDNDDAMRCIKQATNKKPAIFLIPGRVGYNILGENFTELFDANQSIYLYSARGLKADQQQIDNIPDIARDVITEIKKIQAEGPYCLMSVCDGSVIISEICQQLKSNDEAVAPLFFIEAGATMPNPMPKLKRFLRAKKLKRRDKRIPRLENQKGISNHSSINDLNANAKRFRNTYLLAVNNYQLPVLDIDLIRITIPQKESIKANWQKHYTGNYHELHVINELDHLDVFDFNEESVRKQMKKGLGYIYDYLNDQGQYIERDLQQEST
ncbi:MAG: hypothetical protein HRT89_23260 [Lentisphaeria bacterium]|nr:phosphopantetheine-binding protein [Lentisphaeria bacterium]NQZ70980.1 hypothetical protein [Lentisphaeria bacterium]